jgi:K+/H+ antiporter YhaU regulatory subunit KhtT
MLGVTMRKLKVRHELLPGVGERFEFKASSGLTVIVVSHRSGRRDVSLRVPGEDESLATVGLTRTESVALATLLTGAQIEFLVSAPE